MLHSFPQLFAYIGPETFLPVTSVLAAVVGFFLMFGRAALRFGVGWLSSWFLRPERSGSPRPHFRRRARPRSKTLQE